jgi:hypothetical protein
MKKRVLLCLVLFCQLVAVVGLVGMNKKKRKIEPKKETGLLDLPADCLCEVFVFLPQKDFIKNMCVCKFFYRVTRLRHRLITIELCDDNEDRESLMPFFNRFDKFCKTAGNLRVEFYFCCINGGVSQIFSFLFCENISRVLEGLGFFGCSSLALDNLKWAKNLKNLKRFHFVGDSEDNLNFLGYIPKNLEKMQLNFESNYFDDKVGAKLLTEFKELRELELGVSIEYLMGFCFKFPPKSLKILKLFGVHPSGEGKLALLEHLCNLEHLCIERSGVTGEFLHYKSLQRLFKGLRSLSLHFCQELVEEELDFKNMQQLTELDVRFTDISGKQLGFPDHLRILDVSSCKKLNEKVFFQLLKKLKKLKSLNISLLYINGDYFCLIPTGLLELYCVYCEHIKKGNLKKLANLKNLKRLDIRGSYNNDRKIIDYLRKKLGKIKIDYIDYSDCGAFAWDRLVIPLGGILHPRN